MKIINGMKVINALTIDVEDYYQVTNFEGHISREDWPNYPSRVVPNTKLILGLLGKYDIKATFFVLGYVAERHPELVQEIAAAGHEIGSHTYWHRLIFELSPDEFRDDLRRSRDLLQDIIGQPVTSFRAPSFSITKQSIWALEILVEEGFKTDSSIFPIHHSRYGIPDAQRLPYFMDFAKGRLCEFPMTVCRMKSRFHFPIAGGGYFRLFPFQLTKALLQRVNLKYSLPFVFYVHPWEFDPEQPRLQVGTRSHRFRHYVNLSKNESKFERLLKTFKFGRMDDVLTDYFAHTASPSVASSKVTSCIPAPHHSPQRNPR